MLCHVMSCSIGKSTVNGSFQYSNSADVEPLAPWPCMPWFHWSHHRLCSESPPQSAEGSAPAGQVGVKNGKSPEKWMITEGTDSIGKLHIMELWITELGDTCWIPSKRVQKLACLMIHITFWPIKINYKDPKPHGTLGVLGERVRLRRHLFPSCQQIHDPETQWSPDLSK